mmetsp:Transcript_6904/g.19971  ORF Transcript_6904/g.19971 Transcript_6904/m.19971 type:complete len:240 (+) Transcript_6904:2538-3257(+)
MNILNSSNNVGYFFNSLYRGWVGKLWRGRCSYIQGISASRRSGIVVGRHYSTHGIFESMVCITVVAITNGTIVVVVVAVAIVVVAVAIIVVLWILRVVCRDAGPQLLRLQMGMVCGRNIVCQICQRPSVPPISHGFFQGSFGSNTVVASYFVGTIAAAGPENALLVLVLQLPQSEFLVGLGLNLCDLSPNIDATLVFLETQRQVYSLSGTSFLKIRFAPCDNVVPLSLIRVPQQNSSPQ